MTQKPEYYAHETAIIDQPCKIGNGTKIWEGNDGGVWTSTNGGASWSNKNSDLATALLYNVAVHPITPERMLGGSQDNGTPERPGPVSPWVQL